MSKFTIEKIETTSPFNTYLVALKGTETVYMTLSDDEISELHAAIHEFFGEQETPKKIPPLHPGEVLLEEFIKPKYGSVKNFTDKHFEGFFTKEYYFDITTGGDRRITDFHAEVLANIFGTTQEFWLGLQADYDREMKEE